MKTSVSEAPAATEASAPKAADPLRKGIGALSDPLASAVQADSGSPGGDDPLGAASSGVSNASASLPHLDAIQASFGKHDVSGVKAQVGGPAAQAANSLGATAFATGEKTAFKGTPDLHTAAHEAAHVVQQRSGVRLKGGVGTAGDAYEQNADAVADAVVAGKSAEGLLDPVAGGSGPSPGGNAVQKLEATRSSVEKAQLTLQGPAFGVPGLKWNIQAEGEREVEQGIGSSSSGPETTIKASLAGGIRYDLYFLEVGLDLVGDIEIKVEGNVSTQEALAKGVTEVARWYGAKRLGDVAEKRAMLDSRFTQRRETIKEAYRELQELLASGNYSDFQNGAKSWFLWSLSPRKKAEAALSALEMDIGVLFGLAKATGDQVNAAKAFVNKDALLRTFETAGDGPQAQARAALDQSRNTFLNTFDPTKDKLLSAFDGLDAMKVLTRSPDTQFTGNVGANATGKFGWGGDDSGGDHPNEIEVTAGAAQRITSGDGTLLDLDSKRVYRGKVAGKMGGFGAEVKGEREADGPDKVGWKIELEFKAEVPLNEENAQLTAETFRKYLKPLAQNRINLASLSDVGIALQAVGATARDAALQTDVGKYLAKNGTAEAGSETSLGGELELGWERAASSSPWLLKTRKGKVSAAMLGGTKLGIDMGPLVKKLGKVEGQVQKGWKISVAY